MEKCRNCAKPFGWKTLFTSLFLSYKPITCYHCGAVNIVNIPSRILTGIISILPILYVAFHSFGHSALEKIVYIIVAVCMSFVMMLFYPFFVKYKLYFDN